MLLTNCITSSFIDPNGASVTLDSERTVHEPGHDDALGLSRQIMISTKNEILAAQIRAFLEASEDVEVDAETVEDILEVLVGEDEDENAEPPSESNMDEDEDSHDEDAEEMSVPFPGTADPAQQRGFYFSLLFVPFCSVCFFRELDETWTKQEVKEMLHLLKERGSCVYS